MTSRIGLLSVVLSAWSLGLVALLVSPGAPEPASGGPTIASVIGALEADDVARSLAYGGSPIAACKQLSGQQRMQAKVRIDADGSVRAEVDQEELAGCLDEALEGLPLPEPARGSAIIRLDL